MAHTKMRDLRDYNLVAFLIARNHKVELNGAGGYRALMPAEVFYQEFQEYRLHWRDLLVSIHTVRRQLLSRPVPEQ